MTKVTRPWTRQLSGRPAGGRAFLACLAAMIVMCVCGGLTAGSAFAEPNSAGFGPSPGPLQSRCAALVVSSHLAFDGRKLTAHAGPAQPDSCGGGKVSWTWSVSSGVRGCKADSTTCTFRVSASTADTWQQVCINGGSTQGGFESCDYYGVPAKGTGIIDGYVRDRDGGPVVGADVTAYGRGYGRRGAGAATGADGFYAIQVKAGSYSVIPSGGPHGKTEPRYEPSVVHTEVKRDSTERADFELKAGIELKLTFARHTVSANGLEVLNGTIETTEFGKRPPTSRSGSTHFRVHAPQRPARQRRCDHLPGRKPRLADRYDLRPGLRTGQRHHGRLRKVRVRTHRRHHPRHLEA